MAKRVKPSDISKLTQEVERLSAELASPLTGTGDIRKQAKLMHAVQNRMAVLGAYLGGIVPQACYRPTRFKLGLCGLGL